LHKRGVDSTDPIIAKRLSICESSIARALEFVNEGRSRFAYQRKCVSATLLQCLTVDGCHSRSGKPFARHGVELVAYSDDPIRKGRHYVAVLVNCLL
jgi:hypothetical protein